ncbi:hypothetical protein [Prevotella sp. 10(H)]|uniref:hypothetical protein n=1 Tax=Prevotella sp. 10(H) TaxID=1158294 RepID=UPI0004A70F8C|nr:hypothetical protein [Prevotella sp. 10(H)]
MAIEKKNTDIVFYSHKRYNYIIGIIFLIIAIALFVSSVLFIKNSIMEIIDKKQDEEISGTIVGLILTSLLFIAITCLFVLRSYANLFNKREVARLADDGLFFSEMNGRMQIHQNYIKYSNIGKVYIERTLLPGTKVVIESNDEPPVILATINGLLRTASKTELTEQLNERLIQSKKAISGDLNDII